MLKIGDKVRWLSAPRPMWEGEIIDGPWGGLTVYGWDEHSERGATYTVTGYIDGRAWLVRFPDQPTFEVKLLGESALEPVERWEPCPGAHRKSTGRTTWERRV